VSDSATICWSSSDGLTGSCGMALIASPGVKRGGLRCPPPDGHPGRRDCGIGPGSVSSYLIHPFSL